MINYGPLPAPAARYDWQNEAAFRKQIERVMAALARELPQFPGEFVEGATLTVVDGVPTWVAPP